MPLARKSVIAGILHQKPPWISCEIQGGFLCAHDLSVFSPRFLLYLCQVGLLGIRYKFITCYMSMLEFSEIVAEHLGELRAFDRRQILDHIDAQLTHQPTLETRNKKKLVGLNPPWEHVKPIWELRIGEF